MLQTKVDIKKRNKKRRQSFLCFQSEQLSEMLSFCILHVVSGASSSNINISERQGRSEQSQQWIKFLFPLSSAREAVPH